MIDDFFNKPLEHFIDQKLIGFLDKRDELRPNNRSASKAGNTMSFVGVRLVKDIDIIQHTISPEVE